MATPSPSPSLNLWVILSESKRIINAHSRHFLALSVIFLLPLSFSLIVSPLLLSPSPTPSHVHILLRFNQAQAQAQHTDSPFTFSFSFPILLFVLFLSVFFLCALATITHSVFNGFFGRPVKLLSAIVSIPTAFPPLLATAIISNLILFSFSLIVPLLLFLLDRLGVAVAISDSSPIFLTASALLILALFFAIFYLRISWTLASVIVVVESTWGIEPLRRSANLMKGMRGVGASLFLLFASLEGLLFWSSSLVTVASDGGAWKDWAFVVKIVMTSTLLMLLLLYNAAADTVLYMYCKAVHGELASEIAEEFAWQYVSLPFDDGKVPHVVSVVHVQ